MTTKQKIAVMMAYENGAEVERKQNEPNARQQWHRVDLPKWNWHNYDYRVAKPLITCHAPNCNKELEDMACKASWAKGVYCSTRCAYIADVMWAVKKGVK